MENGVERKTWTWFVPVVPCLPTAMPNFFGIKGHNGHRWNGRASAIFQNNSAIPDFRMPHYAPCSGSATLSELGAYVEAAMLTPADEIKT